MEQQPQLPENRLNYLQETLIRQALKQGGQRGWERMAPLRTQLVTCIACFTALATLAICGVGLAITISAPSRGTSHYQHCGYSTRISGHSSGSW